jgi:hypothetical protein
LKTRYVKLPTLVISSGEKREVYRSAGEVPEGLREKLIRSTRGENSATFWIADKKGREAIARAAAGDRPLLAPQSPGRGRPLPVWLLRAIGIALAAGAASASWLAFRFRPW